MKNAGGGNATDVKGIIRYFVREKKGKKVFLFRMRFVNERLVIKASVKKAYNNVLQE